MTDINTRHNGKDYLVCEDGRIYALQQKYDNGYCFGRKPGVVQKRIQLDPEANLYQTITKKMNGNLKPSNFWKVNKQQQEKRKRNSRTVTL